VRREPSLTYEGALKILGRHDRPGIEKLDRLLGGVILGAGIAAGAGAPVVFAAIWGWVDQKSEATSLLRKMLDRISDRLLGTSGYERHQLIAAAHTTIVVAAVFETVQEDLGDEQFAAFEITKAEREATVGGERRDVREHLVAWLYELEVPIPSPSVGFDENQVNVLDWMSGLFLRLDRFLAGLAAWNAYSRHDLLGGSNRQRSLDRCRSNYHQLAADVPEFLVWASLGEHAATRHAVTGVRTEIIDVLDGQRAALSRVEELLGLVAGESRDGRDLGAVLYRANRAALDEHIVAEDAMRSSGDISFPTLREAFVNPRYRLAPNSPEARVADESWWQGLPVFGDLDLLLAGQVMATDATRVPLLLLGHPGAGKSLLTKVLAARLPASAYTVVRVPLRRVSAEAPVYQQIQQALDQATHRRIDWWELADQSRATIRVVLLDGLDELLQAAGNRGGYLQEVEEFQRREADQHRPVVVVVTSRTVVADRVVIPADTAVIKLEAFEEQQIAEWLGVWNRANAGAIDAGTVRGLTLETAMGHPELACQPLLLLMLALHSADPAAPPLDAGSSEADLYRRLLETFTRREVGRPPAAMSDADLADAVREQLLRLSVAAFAMFNRGRQNVTDAELGTDLAALGEQRSGFGRVAEIGQRLIGQFFFVHTAEAQTHGPDETRQCYEFMHATFGEYLLAQHITDLLADLAHVTFGGRHGVGEPNDDLLYALLSHHPLAVRGPALEFVAELCAEFEVEEQDQIRAVLELLIAGCRRRHGSDRYSAYRPTSLDRVRELAAYSANLVLLRAFFEPAAHVVPIARLWPNERDALAAWRSAVALWKSGLDAVDWESVLSALTYVEGVLQATTNPRNDLAEDVMNARLVGDNDAETRLRWGYAVHDGNFYRDPDERRADFKLCSIILKQRGKDFPMGTLRALVKWYLSFAGQKMLDPYALAAALAAMPDLLDDFPELADSRLYADSPGVPLLFELEELVGRDRIAPMSAEERRQQDLLKRMAALLDAYRWKR
jgi:ATPase family associated with various cellular activities (AAA)